MDTRMDQVVEESEEEIGVNGGSYFCDGASDDEGLEEFEEVSRSGEQAYSSGGRDEKTTRAGGDEANKDGHRDENSELDEDDGAETMDLMDLPRKLDEHFERLDKFNYLASVKIEVGEDVQVRGYKDFLGKKPTQKKLDQESLASERAQAMDLLDALSRSGELPLVQTQVHIVVAISHSVDDSVMTALVEKDINPIARLEHSAALMATALTGEPLDALVQAQHCSRLRGELSSELFKSHFLSGR